MLKSNKFDIYRSIDKAITMFDKYGLIYELKDCFTGYFYVWDLDGNFYEYWSTSEKIIQGKDGKYVYYICKT